MKDIVHLIFILLLFYLLLMMNLDLLKRRLVLKSVNFGRIPSKKKWRPWIKMRTRISLNCLMEGNMLVVNGCLRRN